MTGPRRSDLTLKSVARQSVAPGEIIVADDGSGPETACVVERWKGRLWAPLVHLWQPHEGFRLARSRNRAIAAANGNYLIIVDGDMVLHEHFVADHLSAARRGSFIQGVRLLTEAEAAERMLREGCMDLGFLRTRYSSSPPHGTQSPAQQDVVLEESRAERHPRLQSGLLEKRPVTCEWIQRGLRRLGPRGQ